MLLAGSQHCNYKNYACDSVSMMFSDDPVYIWGWSTGTYLVSTLSPLFVRSEKVLCIVRLSLAPYLRIKDCMWGFPTSESFRPHDNCHVYKQDCWSQQCVCLLPNMHTCTCIRDGVNLIWAAAVVHEDYGGYNTCTRTHNITARHCTLSRRTVVYLDPSRIQSILLNSVHKL